MLLEFSVANFRSIREKQTFSMVASPDKEHQGTNSMETGLMALPRALRVAAIYGANAAGKSNLLKALGFMRNIVRHSANGTQEGQELDFTPFAFDEKSKQESGYFEVHFIEGEVRYEYGFRLTRERIVEEWLNASPKGRIQKWFHREWSDGEYRYEYGSHFQGLKQVWEKSTRANALYLSTAIQLNSEQLRPIFGWFQAKLNFLSDMESYGELMALNMLSFGGSNEFLSTLMRIADPSIDGFNAKKGAPETVADRASGIVEQNKGVVTDVEYRNLLAHYSRKEVSVFHGTGIKGDRAELKLEDESNGTQRLFALAWPWMDAVQRSAVLLVDELDASLHPLMAKFLIGVFMSSYAVKNQAQLIFTTHNTSFLGGDFLRRDQVWFLEKDEQNSSRFYPLSDFSPRKNEAFEKGYLNGRYGALPYIEELKF